MYLSRLHCCFSSFYFNLTWSFFKFSYIKVCHTFWHFISKDNSGYSMHSLSPHPSTTPKSKRRWMTHLDVNKICPIPSRFKWAIICFVSYFIVSSTFWCWCVNMNCACCDFVIVFWLTIKYINIYKYIYFNLTEH